MALAALAAAVSCAAPPTAPLHEVHEFSLQGGFITGSVSIPTSGAGPKPVALRPILDERVLLERGIATARFHVNWEALSPPPARDAPAPEPPGGETVGRWILASPRPEIVGRAYFELIAGEADVVVAAVLDHLETLPQIDSRRMGIGGSSTAGFVALEAFQRDPRLAVAVVRVACGDYPAFLRDSSLALNGEARWLPGGELVLEPEYANRLQERQAISTPGAFPPRPLLLLNGALDRAIPLTCVHATAEALAAAYEEAGASDRFRAVVFEDGGHDLGPEGDREVLAWWERWLQPPRPGR